MTCDLKAMKFFLLEFSISFVEHMIDNLNCRSQIVAKGLLGFSLANDRVLSILISWDRLFRSFGVDHLLLGLSVLAPRGHFGLTAASPDVVST